MPNVLFATSEASPFIQTGGLAEVSGSLPKSLARLGCDVRLVLPAHGAIKASLPGLVHRRALVVPGFAEACAVLSLPLEPSLELWLIDCPALFDRPGGPYADPAGVEWPDNPYRYAFFCHAVAALAVDDPWRPTIVHAHDWPTALLPALLSLQSPRPRTVFTIHNLAFRGLCDRATFDHLHLPPDWWHYERLEFHDQCALLKGGLVFADRLTTVSPTYAREILTPEFGHGLDGLLRNRAGVLSGILNGIDTDVWDPARDTALTARYSARSLARRAQNRRALQTAFGLPLSPDSLLCGIVSRLTAQKGIDLMLDALATAGPDTQCVILGSGEPVYEQAALALARAQPERIACRLGYDTALSHQLFAGVDAFLMPSRFEPCGLSQLYSQRYGAVPIVRRTGGLADSVRDLALDKPTGIVFDDATPAAFSAALARAGTAFRDQKAWRRLQRNGMRTDFSWARSAGDYLALYRDLIGR
jgi:starch synthase